MDEFKSSRDYLGHRENNSESALGGKTNDNQTGVLKEPLNEPLTEPTLSRNGIKKAPSSKSHFEENHRGSEKDARLRCRSNLSDKVQMKDGAVLSSKNTSVTNSIASADSYKAEDSFEKFFQISREAKQELSEHVNKLLSHANESDRFETPRKNSTETDKSYDQMNKKGNNIKRSKKKSKKKKTATYDQDDVYENFRKMQTSLYDGANEATSFIMTNVFSKKIDIEKNIVKYDDMLSKHSENFFKRFELFEQEDESMDEAEAGWQPWEGRTMVAIIGEKTPKWMPFIIIYFSISCVNAMHTYHTRSCICTCVSLLFLSPLAGISLVDKLCEYFTYVMFLTLNR